MDRLRTMQSFVRVMHSGSFTIAARQLGISRALVSRHIIDLERHLGIRLLNRSTRNVMPTEEAIAYLAFCEQILGEIEKGERSFAQTRSRLSDTLRIVAPKSFGTMNLADAILDFAQAEPKIRISLVLEDFSFRPHEFVEKGYDLAICIASMPDTALMSRTIGPLDWVLCASPGYIRRKNDAYWARVTRRAARAARPEREGTKGGPPVRCLSQTPAVSSMTLTSTCMLRNAEAGPMNVPHSGSAFRWSHATATRIRLRFPTMLFVGSKSTHPAPGKYACIQACVDPPPTTASRFPPGMKM